METQDTDNFIVHVEGEESHAISVGRTHRPVSQLAPFQASLIVVGL